jgi:rubrerythrin
LILIRLDKLERLANNLEKAGGSDEALARLGEIEDLDKEAENARRGRDSANRDRVEAENQLSAVRTQIVQAVATRDRQNAENAALYAKNVKAESELAAVQEKVRANSNLIEFAVVIQLLFSDISKIHPLQLMELAEMLNMISRARLNPAAIYPIDFEGIRDKAVEMLGLVLGKALVTRKAFDDVIKSMVEPHDDLLLEKLVKIEHELIHLTEEKTDMAAKKDALERAVFDKLLPAALDSQTKGFIVLHRCRTCSRTLAALPAGVGYSITVCPFCGEKNP